MTTLKAMLHRSAGSVDAGDGRVGSLSIKRVHHARRAMRDELLAKYREAHDLLEGSVGATARSRHRIGEIVLEVMANVDRYGDRGVALLATALGRNEDTLYEWARVADTWRGPTFAALLRRRTVHNVPLSVSHLVVLSSIKDASARAAATEQALSDGLSVKRLRRAIDIGRQAIEATDEGADEALGARRILGRLSKCAGTAIRRTSRLVSSLETMPEDELESPDVVEALSRGVNETRQLLGEFGRIVARLEARLERVTESNTVVRSRGRARTA